MEQLNNTSAISAPSEQPEGSTPEMASWEDQLEKSLEGSTLKHGELREGTILYQKETGLVIDIGAKRDGFVPMADLEELVDTTFEVGQDVPVIVTRFQDSDGNVELSISQALLQEDWLKAEKLLENQEVYETKVLAANRGGLTVEFGRLRGFIPMSQLIGFSRVRQATERHRRLRSMIDQTIMVKVIEVNRRRRRLIFSQLAAAKEWRAIRREQLLGELEEGQVRRGRISQITDFGLFVNLGGLDGLVHISELSWGRIEKPSEVYRPGQRVKVKVISVDRERQRIALSIKALTPDPWDTAPERYTLGQMVEGHISQLVDFGAFIEIEPGVEGLLHNSELRDYEQREELEASGSVLVKVIRVESERRRMGLSVRQVRPEEWEEWALAQMDAAMTPEPEAEESVEEEATSDKSETGETAEQPEVSSSEEQTNPSEESAPEVLTNEVEVEEANEVAIEAEPEVEQAEGSEE